jgi:hypothetical protein
MGHMRLFALNVDEAREMFGASPELADELRTLAAPLLTQSGLQPESTHHRGRHTSGPSDAASTNPPVTADDVEQLIAGHFVPPQKLDVAWQIVTAWFTGRAWDHLDLAVNAGTINGWDFDLARFGMSSTYALAQLGARDAQLPLRPVPGLRVGYQRHDHAVHTQLELATYLADLDTTTQHQLQPVNEFLRNLPGWAADAEEARRLVPDIVCLWWLSD